jgi:hypothetical protein
MSELVVDTKDMTYTVEAGQLPYQIVWQLGTETLPQLQSVGYQQNFFGYRNLTELMNRSPRAIASADHMIGRTLTYTVDPFNSQTLDGTELDTVEILGYGYNPLIRDDRGLTTTSNKILLPRADSNYRDITPNTTHTEVYEKGKWKVIAQDFLFPGACTYAEVVNKAGAQLALYELLISNFGNLPFLVPLPEYIGKYQNLIDPTTGLPAYFMVNRVPYGGRRSGIFFDLSKNEDFQDSVEDAIFIGPALRMLHDLGIIHNQMVLGNFYTYPGIEKSLIADLATLTPLDNTPSPISTGRRGVKSTHWSRAHDLAKIGSSMAYTRQTKRDEYLPYYHNALLGMYLGIDRSLGIIKSGEHNNVKSFAYGLLIAQKQGLFNPPEDIDIVTESSWQVINKWKAYIADAIK